MSALASSMSFVATAAPTPQASLQPPHCDEATGDGFSRCLQQARENDANAADDAAHRPGAKKPAANAKADRSAREPGAGRAAERAAAPPKAQVDADAEAAIDTADDSQATAAAPDLAALLPGWTSPPAAAPTAVPAATAVANNVNLLRGGSAVGGVKVSPTPSRDERVARAATPAIAAPAAAEVNANPTATATATAHATAHATANANATAFALPSSDALQTAASEHQAVTPDLTSAPLSNALTSLPVTASTTTPPMAAPKSAETPALTATVPAPIDSPAFAPSLATQVRWWASDGVQQAQLQLNPAEMGPVTVRIVVLDGREARIDFSADLAATRSAIEAALPVLAAALDDGGLKLTGGGVHDGSAQQRPAWHAHSVTHRTTPSSAAPGDDPAATAASARHAAGRGMVDLVA